MDAASLSAALAERGVLINPTGSHRLRAVTNYQVSAADVETVLGAIEEVLAGWRTSGKGPDGHAVSLAYALFEHLGGHQQAELPGAPTELAPAGNIEFEIGQRGGDERQHTVVGRAAAETCRQLFEARVVTDQHDVFGVLRGAAQHFKQRFGTGQVDALLPPNCLARIRVRRRYGRPSVLRGQQVS